MASNRSPCLICNPPNSIHDSQGQYPQLAELEETYSLTTTLRLIRLPQPLAHRGGTACAAWTNRGNSGLECVDGGEPQALIWVDPVFPDPEIPDNGSPHSLWITLISCRKSHSYSSDRLESEQ